MNCKLFTVNPIQENCYVIWDETTHDGAIIDCGAWKDAERQDIAAYIDKEKINLRYALQTHCHFDHIWGTGFIHDKYGLKPKCHPLDVETYSLAPEMVQRWFRMPLENMPELDATLSESTTLPLAGTEIQVLHTPGHTPGGVCFYLPEARLVFSGDTLFRMGMGRTDLAGGSWQDEIKSITTKLLTLPPDTRVLPGHGPETTIGEEMDQNPYLK